MNTYTKFNFLTRLLTLGTLLLCSSAFAGYVYEFQEAEGDDALSLMVEGEMVRISSGADSETDLIFNTKSQTMIVLDHTRKRYVELDKATVSDLASQIENAMAEMEKQLASIPPAQRQMVENMMKGKMEAIGTPLPEIKIERTGVSDTKSGYKVEKLLLLEDDAPVRELWVTDWDNVKGSEELAKALKSMSEMFDDLMQAFSSGPMGGMMGGKSASDWYGQIEDIGGMPIVTSELSDNGETQSQSKLTKVEERAIETSAFEIPKGYKKQKMKM